MGNYCLQEDATGQKKTIVRTSMRLRNTIQNLLSINKKFYEECNDPYFINFHKEILERDIVSFGKLMSSRKIQFSLKHNYPTEDEQQLIYKEIVKDTKYNEKNLYNQMVQHYTQFLNELFELEYQIPLQQVTSYNLGNVRTSTQLTKNHPQTRSFSEHHKYLQMHTDQLQLSQNVVNQNIAKQFYENKKLAYVFLDQLNCIFKLCQSIIEYMYGGFIVSLYKNDIESFTDRALLISKVYQTDIFKSNPQFSYIIQNALFVNYENKSALIKSEFTSPQILNPTLLPQFTDSIKSDTSFELLDSCEKIYIPHTLSYQNFQLQNLPYSQTFATVEKIINCKMPWLKFKLIGKLDRQIIEIFLCQRSQSQIAYFIDVIKPEDAKIEVLEFILQKYMFASKSQNLLQCYYELRWMQESDAVIHQKLKTITCPYFSRFISIYEIAYNHYQKKQASQFI